MVEGVAITIEAAQFKKQIQRLTAEWSWPLDALVIVKGKANDDAQEFKSTAIHHWLLGVEFPETAIGLLKSGRVVVLSSSKKLSYLRHLEGPDVILLQRSGPDAEEQQLKSFAIAVRAGKEKAVVGMLLKETHMGPFAEITVGELPKMPGLQVTECKDELAGLLALKTEEELVLCRKAATLAQLIMSGHFMKRLEDVIDRDLKQSNEQVCQEVERILDNEELMAAWKQKYDLDPGEVEVVYISLQSGSQFKIEPAAGPTKEQVPMQGTYVMSIGAKYFEYNACISRTLFVDPTPTQKRVYHLVREVQTMVLQRLKPDAVFKDIYLAAKSRVHEKDPSLVSKFVKNVGFVMGLEFKDPGMVLNEKCERKVVAGMVFCVSVGFADTGQDPWAAWVADTTIVRAEGDCEELTSPCTKEDRDVMFEIDETMAEALDPALPAAPPVPPPKESRAPAAKAAAAKGSAGKAAAAKAPASERPGAKGKAKSKAAPPPEKRSSRRKEPEKSSSAAAAPRGEKRQRQEVRAPEVRTPSKRASVPSSIMQSRTRGRNEQTKRDMKEQAHLEEKQSELRRRKLQEIRERISGKGSRRKGSEGPSGARRLHECQAYSGELPQVRPNRLELDTDAEALLVPIRGAVVPFHVSIIKNMARSTTDRTEFLRVNFFTPGQGKAAEEFPEANGRRLYVKELSFRSLSKDNLDGILRGFKEVQKRMKQREIEGEVRKSSSTKELPPLQLLKPCPAMRDLNMRPNYGSNARRTLGTLEAHANGFRFSMKGGADRVDILYSQVQHVIYEPCEKGSLIVLFHLHLKEPTMVGKRKTQDLQFFTEVAALTEDLSMKKAGSAHDPDEILEEEREREMKERLNNIFLEFSKKVEALPNFKLPIDIPFKQLAFNGVPYKQVVTLCPCKNVLAALQEWPPFCLDLSEIDVVVFERAIMTLREFDIVFVKKDYDQMPIRITTIPQSSLDTIKSWLASIEAVWYACSMNMQWAMVMKDITKDLKAFVENGAWDQWFSSTTADSGSDAEDSDDDESDFKCDEDDDDDSGGGADDADSDFSAEPDEDESEPDSDGDDEDGMSWDELEREAERADKKRDQNHDKSGGASSRSQPPRKGRKS